MKYTLDELLKNHFDNVISVDALDYRIKKSILEGKDITDLVKEKENYTKKVNVVEDLFKENSIGNPPPIRKYVSKTQYKVCEYYYIKNIKDRNYIAQAINTSKNYVRDCIFISANKLRKIEIDI